MRGGEGKNGQLKENNILCLSKEGAVKKSPEDRQRDRGGDAEDREERRVSKRRS